MTIDYFPFDAGNGVAMTEARWSKMADLFRATGPVQSYANGFLVYADSTGMQVKVKTGQAMVKGHYVESDAEEILAIAASNPSNPRIDLVVIRLNWTLNTIALAVLTGTAAGSPSAPALTQSATIWEISLAQVAVAAAAVTVAAGNIADERSFSTQGTMRTEVGLVNELRMTLETAVPFSTTPQAGKATLYFTPAYGNRISLKTGAEWITHETAQVSLSLAALTANLMYDVFAKWSANVVALSVLPYTDLTGTISAATNAAPIVLTVNAAPGIVTNDYIYVSGVAGNTAANGWWKVTVSGTSVTLLGSVGNGAYSSGGTWRKTNQARATALTRVNGVLVSSADNEARYIGRLRINATGGQTDDMFMEQYPSRLPVAQGEGRQLAAYAYRTGDVSGLGSGAFQVLTWQAVYSDGGALWDGATKFRIPVDGVYDVRTNLNVYAGGTVSASIAIRQNGKIVARSVVYPAGYPSQCGAILECKAGDYFDFAINNYTSTATLYAPTATEDSFVAVRKVD
jgi:hypothetical protein